MTPIERTASATVDPCDVSTSTWRSLATISLGLCLLLAISILLQGSKPILQVGPQKRGAFADAIAVQYARRNDFLLGQTPEGTLLFERFELAEPVFTPLFNWTERQRGTIQRMLPYLQYTPAFSIGSYPFAAAFSNARSSEWLMQIESISAELTPLGRKACFIPARRITDLVCAAGVDVAR